MCSQCSPSEFGGAAAAAPKYAKYLLYWFSRWLLVSGFPAKEGTAIGSHPTCSRTESLPSLFFARLSLLISKVPPLLDVSYTPLHHDDVNLSLFPLCASALPFRAADIIPATGAAKGECRG